MRSMRCDSCGTKALMAASKCPKCGHGFEVRDGFGDMLPLSHCSTCDAYYPAKLGACKWCGTQPERAPMGPYVWKGVGVAAFVAMAWGAWLVHDDPPADVSAKRMQAMLKPDSSALADTALTPVTIASAGSVIADSVAPTDVVAPDSGGGGVPLSMVAQVDTVSMSATGVVPEPEPIAPVDSPVAREPEVPPSPEPVHAPAPEPVREVVRPRARVAERSPTRAPARATTTPRAKAPAKAPPRAVASAKKSGKPAAKTVAKAPAKRSTKSVAAAPKARTNTRWVNSVARNWVIVRASASPQSRIIASIGPNTRVQLGESRGGWRRIKAKGLAGWVEHRSFFAGTSGSGGTSRLAVR